MPTFGHSVPSGDLDLFGIKTPFRAWPEAGDDITGDKSWVKAGCNEDFS